MVQTIYTDNKSELGFIRLVGKWDWEKYKLGFGRCLHCTSIKLSRSIQYKNRVADKFCRNEFSVSQIDK
jgi:hypothetical protein